MLHPASRRGVLTRRRGALWGRWHYRYGGFGGEALIRFLSTNTNYSLEKAKNWLVRVIVANFTVDDLHNPTK